MLSSAVLTVAAKEITTDPNKPAEEQPEEVDANGNPTKEYEKNAAYSCWAAAAFYLIMAIVLGVLRCRKPKSEK